MNSLRSRLSYANVVSTICLFLLLGGGAALAATKLARNSVGTPQLKRGAVTGAKVKNHSLSGTDINLSRLGTVPRATSTLNAGHAASADTASVAVSLPPLEASHVVGAPGEPPFRGGASNAAFGSRFAPVGFFKDHDGIVRLEGFVEPGSGEDPISGVVFQLPPGFRPPAGQIQAFTGDETEILILGSGISEGSKDVSGAVVAAGSSSVEELSGLSFRAGS